LGGFPVLSAPKPASVSVRNLARRYGDIEAVRGVNFDVGEGEVFGVLGRNGAGKTTTLECLLGLRRPDSGSIAIGGIDALENPRQARRVIGAQLQGATLQDKITPVKVLGLFAAFYARPASVDGLIEAFGLTEKRNAPFNSLSGGQRQRLFLALALVNNPRLVVLDEPTAGLDPQSRHDLHDLILDMRRTGRTVVLSTHDLDEAHRLCDRVAILDRGRIVAIDTPAALIAASGSSTRVQFRTTKPMEASVMAALPGVQRSELKQGSWVLRTANLGETIVGLVRIIESSGNGLEDLQVQKPSLEDAFLALTGKEWSD
jgi:ABC-2 type transport system ATP-binding protein